MILVILFIIYTICVCLDGPDLKPKWKHWLGSRLYRHAVSLNSSIEVPSLMKPIPVFVEHRRPTIIHAAKIVDNYEIFAYERMHGISYNEAANTVINYIKKQMMIDLAYKMLDTNYIRWETIPDLSREQIRIIATVMISEPYTIR